VVLGLGHRVSQVPNEVLVGGEKEDRVEERGAVNRPSGAVAHFLCSKLPCSAAFR
jgi:hypothetical protein